MPQAKKKIKKKTAVKAKKVSKKIPAKKKAVKKALVKKRATKKVVAPKGLPEQMLEAALKVLNDRKAEDIIPVSLSGRSAIADYMIIASGRAARQIVALADHLREAFFKLGVRTVRVEGRDDANWVLVDAGDIVIHLFRPDVRKYYDLDALWSKKASRK